MLSSYQNSSSSVVASNVDMLRQILLCLPVKSLLVFKSVSKQWLSLISDPSFIHNHYVQNCLSPHGLILKDKGLSGFDYPVFKMLFLNGNITGDGTTLKYFTMSDETSQVQIEIIEHSCNGLLLCSNESDGRCSIYNPSTKHCRVLPSHFGENELNRVISVSLAFDPLKSTYYEVVCIIQVYLLKIAIYSSKTASWRHSGATLSEFVNFVYMLGVFCNGVFWNGSLHWIDIEWMFGFYFDIDKDLVKTMPLPLIPDEFQDSQRLKYFGECRGHLHLIYIHGSSTTRFDILEMDTDYTGWSIKYHVDLEGLVISYQGGINPNPFQFSVLLVEDEEESPKLVLEIPSNMVIISYDLKEMSFKKIHEFASLPDRNGHYAYPYMETLACV